MNEVYSSFGPGTRILSAWEEKIFATQIRLPLLIQEVTIQTKRDTRQDAPLVYVCAYIRREPKAQTTTERALS